MVRGFDACDAAHLVPPRCAVHWFAHGGPAPMKVAASAARLAERWAPLGVALHFHPVDGVPFWATSDIAECPALLAATASVFAPSAS
jgi:hypothetical protein